eukprot:UN01941
MSKIVSDPGEESFLERNIKSRINQIFKRSFSSVEECEKKLTPSAVRSYNDAFCALDTNKDGIISIEELERLLESIGVHVNRQSVLNMMAEVGGQGAGFVDYVDFLHFLTTSTMDEQTDFEND